MNGALTKYECLYTFIREGGIVRDLGWGLREDNHDLGVKIFGTHGSTWYSMNHVI